MKRKRPKPRGVMDTRKGAKIDLEIRGEGELRFHVTGEVPQWRSEPDQYVYPLLCEVFRDRNLVGTLGLLYIDIVKAVRADPSPIAIADVYDAHSGDLHAFYSTITPPDDVIGEEPIQNTLYIESARLSEDVDLGPLIEHFKRECAAIGFVSGPQDSAVDWERLGFWRAKEFWLDGKRNFTLVDTATPSIYQPFSRCQWALTPTKRASIVAL